MNYTVIAENSIQIDKDEFERLQTAYADALEENKQLADDQLRLDFLDSLSGTYTGKVILRMSETGRGWRLHETSTIEASPTVREAIDKFRNEKNLTN